MNKVKRKKNVNFRNRIKLAGRQQVKVGYFKDAEKHENSKDLTITQLAIVMEFGNDKMNVPARPFVRTTFASNKAKIRKASVLFYAQAIKGNYSVKMAGNKIGALVEGMVKMNFTKGKFKNLSENYKVRPSGQKVTDRSKVLIDTGTLRNSVSYRVGRTL